jgi:hypothetical protein
MMEPGYYWATTWDGNRVIVEVDEDDGDQSVWLNGTERDVSSYSHFDGPLTDPRTPATAGDTRKDG